MKKLLIGSLVGGILVFVWQSLSWTVLDLHGNEYKKSPNEQAILNTLSSQLTEDGQYMLPIPEKSASADERQKFMEEMQGKPYAIINYQKAWETDMVGNILRGLIASIIAAFFVCWIMMKDVNSRFLTTFINCILVGVAAYLFFPYTGMIWFKTPGATTFFIDALVSWGLCGLWLGWWLNRGK